MNNKNSNRNATLVFVLMVLLLVMGMSYLLFAPGNVDTTTKSVFAFLGQQFTLLAGYLAGQRSSKSQ